MSTHVSLADGSGAMFDGIAPRYDLLNRLISFGLDRGWRRALLDSLGTPCRVLDVATGTGDVALALAHRHPQAAVVGLDPSVGMLEVARRKVAAAGLGERIELVEGDAQAMDFPGASFDACCIAFGIRNVPDRAAALAEMTRVLRPGGVLAVLELSEPQGGAMAALARFHVHQVVPRVGALLSGADAYRYLRRSIAAFPPADAFVAMLGEAGLEQARARRLSFGTAHLFTARRPP